MGEDFSTCTTISSEFSSKLWNTSDLLKILSQSHERIFVRNVVSKHPVSKGLMGKQSNGGNHV